MTIRVSSGNEAKVTLIRGTGRVVVDVGWSRPPKRKDLAELNRLLGTGNQMAITVEDDAARGEFVRKFLAARGESEAAQ